MYKRMASRRIGIARACISATHINLYDIPWGRRWSRPEQKVDPERLHESLDAYLTYTCTRARTRAINGGQSEREEREAILLIIVIDTSLNALNDS